MSQSSLSAYSTVPGKNDLFYDTDMNESVLTENNASTFDSECKNQGVEGYRLKVSSTKFHQPKQYVEIARHGTTRPLEYHNAPALRKNKTVNFRKLVLTFQSDEKPEGGIDGIC